MSSTAYAPPTAGAAAISPQPTTADDLLTALPISRRRTRRLPWLLGALALSLVYTVQPLRDPDVWWHLAVGRLIVGGVIPSQEPFSFAPAPHPWIGQQWLYELTLARVVDHGGAGAAMLLMGVVGSLAFVVAALAVRRGRRVSPAISAAAILLCGLAAGTVLGVRGQVITVLGTALTLLVIVRWRDGSRPAVLALPPLLAAWANLHAGFVVGLALPIVAATVVAVHRRAGGDEPASVRWLLGATGLAGLATLANPAGPHLLGYIAQTFTTPTLTQSIVEWQSPDFHSNALRLVELIAVLLVVCWALSRRPDPLDVALGVLTLSATLQAQRNLALFAVVATPQLAVYGTAALERARGALVIRRPGASRPRSPRPGQRKRAGLALPLAAALCLGAAAVIIDVLPRTGAAATARYEREHEPSAAVGYAAVHLAGQRLYAPYEWGGYLAERLGGRVTYIYGESAVFGEQRLEEYLDVHLLHPDWATVLQRRQIDTAIVPGASQEAGAMLSTGWTVACRDTGADALVLRRGPLLDAAGAQALAPADPGSAPWC